MFGWKIFFLIYLFFFFYCHSSGWMLNLVLFYFILFLFHLIFCLFFFYFINFFSSFFLFPFFLFFHFSLFPLIISFHLSLPYFHPLLFLDLILSPFFLISLFVDSFFHIVFFLIHFSLFFLFSFIVFSFFLHCFSFLLFLCFSFHFQCVLFPRLVFTPYECYWADHVVPRTFLQGWVYYLAPQAPGNGDYVSLDWCTATYYKMAPYQILFVGKSDKYHTFQCTHSFFYLCSGVGQIFSEFLFYSHIFHLSHSLFVYFYSYIFLSPLHT